MNLVLTHGQRKRAEVLLRATTKDGADATLALLRDFPDDLCPALVAWLARIACEVRDLPAHEAARYARNQPDVLTDTQRREAHRLYGRGVRTPEVVTGEREYQRCKARTRRRGLSVAS